MDISDIALKKVLHKNNFLKTHVKYSKLDPSLQGNPRLTLFRNYYIYKFLVNTLKKCELGDILCAGISFGTTALVLSELIDISQTGRKWIFVDPMNGRGKPDGFYNTSKQLVLERWNQRSPMHFIEKYLDPELSKELPHLCFAHLNTGDAKAESSSLPIILDKLLPSGSIFIEYYGRCSEEFCDDIDEAASFFNCTSIYLSTRQLVIIKS